MMASAFNTDGLGEMERQPVKTEYNRCFDPKRSSKTYRSKRGVPLASRKIRWRRVIQEEGTASLECETAETGHWPGCHMVHRRKGGWVWSQRETWGRDTSFPRWARNLFWQSRQPLEVWQRPHISTFSMSINCTHSLDQLSLRWGRQLGVNEFRPWKNQPAAHPHWWWNVSRPWFHTLFR